MKYDDECLGDLPQQKRRDEIAAFKAAAFIIGCGLITGLGIGGLVASLFFTVFFLAGGCHAN